MTIGDALVVILCTPFGWFGLMCLMGVVMAFRD